MRFKIPKKQPANFRASALYLSGNTAKLSPDRVEWVETRNLQTESPEAAAAIMAATAAQSTRCRNPAYHFVLAFDPKDAKAEKVDPGVMREIAIDAIERLGLSDYQALIYAHRDTEHPHIHFLVNRIHPQTGKAYSRHNDGKRLTALVREIARERGLNIAKERGRDKARIPEQELQEDFGDTRATVTDAEYWLARRNNRPPIPDMSWEDVKSLRERVAPHFYNATSWADLSARVGAYGLQLQRKGRGLVLVRGDEAAKLSQMGKGVRLTELEERFGETFDDWELTRIDELVAAEKRKHPIPGSENMTPAQLRRADRLRAAEERVARKKTRDAMTELDHAQMAVHYWKGLDAHYRYGERRLFRAERDAAYAHSRHDRATKFETRWRESFRESLSVTFKDPAKAERVWMKMEAQFGVEETARMLKEKPGLAGGLRGLNVGIAKDETRKKAEVSLRYLKHRRSRWRRAQQDVSHWNDKIEDGRRQVKIAKRDFELIHQRTGTDAYLHKMLGRALERRAAALSRVTEKAIRASNYAYDYKRQLVRALHEYEERSRESEKVKEMEREMPGPHWR